MISPLEQFDAIILFRYINLGNYIDVTVFHTLVPLIILMLLFSCIGIFSNYLTLIFTTLFQRLFEYKLIFIFNLIKQQIGANGYKYVVLFFSIFFFILLLNLLSILPFGIALTSHLILILFMSLSICIGIFIEGYVVLGYNFYKIFLPKCSIFLLPLLLTIEVFSYIIRMFSLAIRLAANIMAGHTLIYIISTFTLLIFSFNFFFIIIGIVLICTIMMLELGVACLQAYVFTILCLIYLNDVYNASH